MKYIKLRKTHHKYCFQINTYINNKNKKNLQSWKFMYIAKKKKINQSSSRLRWPPFNCFIKLIKHGTGSNNNQYVSRITCDMLLKILLITAFVQFCVGQSEQISAECIRCLCHARTGCYQLRNCASYSINRSYWESAGSPTYLDDSPSDRDAFTNCMRDEGCIRRTIVGYISALGLPVCILCFFFYYYFFVIFYAVF